MNSLISLLKEELNRLDQAAEVLAYSYKNCKKIGLKNQYTYAELDQWEAFTSRFARLSDLVIQKIFRLIDIVDLESSGTVRDRIHRAEKKALIENAEIWIQIRIVRNDIAHEYLPEAVQEIYGKVLELAPSLLSGVTRIKQYCEKYGTDSNSGSTNR